MTTEDSVRSRVHAAPPPAQPENQEKCVAEIRRDYIESLNQWLWQCYHWQQVATSQIEVAEVLVAFCDGPRKSGNQTS